ncbi:MAG: M23 family metallopeptidase [Oscillospiraceae bacterium]|nr:M23 family metallopeptidase [Oscillospiraceae bacterium]
MDNQNHDSKFSRFLSGKGFYVALALCLVGTAAAAWVAIDSTQNAILEESSSQLSRSSTSSSSSSRTVSRSSMPGASSSSAAGPSMSGSSSAAVSSSSSMPAIENVSGEETAQVNTEVSDQDIAGNAPTQEAEAPVEDVAVDETLLTTQEPLAFIMPIEGEVFAPYSQGELVRNLTLGEWRTHDGVDIRAAKGSPVRAVADGVVSQVYHDPMWGTVVEITHAGGLTSVTSGLDPAVAVKQGDSVRIEDTIGVVGSILSEVSLDDHVHFGLKQDGKWVDPISAMGKAIQ